MLLYLLECNYLVFLPVKPASPQSVLKACGLSQALPLLAESQGQLGEAPLLCH